MEKQLSWPIEAAQTDSGNSFGWNQAGSNICLDFHGDPIAAKLVVFSDGNHHMALEACCRSFVKSNPQVQDIFYATTPPKVILESTLQDGLRLGNLKLNLQPHVFISPPNILEQLLKKKFMTSHRAFARSRCNVLLVKKGNPKNIRSISDLLRDDVILTISNPRTEKASYNVYKKTLIETAREQGLDVNAFSTLISDDTTRTVFGKSIHHREVPQTLFSCRADAAIVYYHLALRYTRIFPNDFELIEFDSNSNMHTNYHIGLVNDGGDWGQAFFDFMLSDNALKLYAEHGLQAI